MDATRIGTMKTGMISPRRAARDSVLTWTGILWLLTLAMVGLVDAQPQKIDDADITAAIMAEFERDPVVEGDGVNVETQEGVVTLSAALLSLSVLGHVSPRL